MAGSIKILRLQELIRYKVSQTILRDLADPRIGLITITKVNLAKDLSTARIFFSVLGTDGARSRCEHALEHSRGFIQREVAKAMKTRTTPHLVFTYDESIAGSIRVSQLLQEAMKNSPGAVLDGDEDALEEDVDPLPDDEPETRP